MSISVIDIAATGKKIKALSVEKGYSVAKIQQALQLESCQAVYKWFSGKSLPTSDNLVLLAQLFDVKVDDILVIKAIHV